MTLERHESFIITAGVFSLFAFILSFYLIWKHLQNWNEPHLQVPIVRLLLMVPIYSIDSWLSLLMPDKQLYFDTIRDCYEAYVIYMFFVLLVRFLEGEANLLRYLEERPSIPHPWPFSCFHFKPGAKFLHQCKRAILQFVIVKPIDSLVAMILNTKGLYNQGSFEPGYGYLWIALVDNTSICVAMYYLILFYLATEPELKRFRPVPKFLCVKAVVFFSFWQSVLIAALLYFNIIKTEDMAGGLEDMILCIEMFLIALCHIYAFGHNTYRDEEVSASLLLGELREIVDPRLYGKHAKNFTANARTVFKNFTSVANQNDVMKDTYNTFMRNAKRYFDVGDFLTLDYSAQVDRIIKQGTMLKLGERVKTWNERYFVLINKPRGLLYYEKNPFEEVPVDTFKSANYQSESHTRRHVRMKEEPIYFIDFNLVTEIGMMPDGPKRIFKHSFCITTEARTWSLACQNATDLEEWLSVLRPLFEEALAAKQLPVETATTPTTTTSTSVPSSVSTPTIEVIEAIPPPPKVLSSPALTKRDSSSSLSSSSLSSSPYLPQASPIYIRIADEHSPHSPRSGTYAEIDDDNNTNTDNDHNKNE
eukprot:TRINITY_DN2723_c0_g1_i1.p1 TRINITY_DN2723_c0_g1~~TRINITY_DN2723_c0_g1_i1.p1  ORF type:complete len:590 (+),score=132.71 TRINITY_DN2723_c0_g1_i1:191-1960(+)